MRPKDVARLMGQKVLVLKEYERVWADPKKWSGGSSAWNGREWLAQDVAPPRVGWVIGLTHRANGYTMEGGGSYSMDGYDQDPPYFVEVGRVRCLVVCYWPGTKAVLVPLDGYREATPKDGEPEPNSFMVWTEEMRRRLREDMKSEPRDERGRWKKWEPAAVVQA